MVELVHVPELGRGGLVRHVHGVPERQVPDGERLELGVAGVQATAAVVIELGEACGQLAAARARARHHDDGLLGLDVGLAP
jgi:hypothetical protein